MEDYRPISSSSWQKYLSGLLTIWSLLLCLKNIPLDDEQSGVESFTKKSVKIEHNILYLYKRIVRIHSLN